MVQKPPCFLGLDAGTQSVKAGLWSASGEPLAGATRALSVLTPREGWAEQDADTWWTATIGAIRGIGARVRRAGVEALGVAWQRETFVLTDAEGRALRPALLWLDVRSHAECEGLGDSAKRLHGLTGVKPDVTTTLPRMAWLRRHEPEHFRPPPRWMDVGAYLLQRLTGRRVTCVSGADTTGLVSLHEPRWSPEMLELAGLDSRDLPELVGPGEVVGPLLAEAARVLGLPAGLPVVAAGGDGQVYSAMALRGAAAAGLTLSLGTSVVLGVPSTGSPVSDLFRTLRAAWPGGGRLLEAVLQSGTWLLRWLVGAMAPDGMDLADLERAASALPPGSEGLLTIPHWWGSRFPSPRPDARGATLGWSDNHRAAHLYRSLVEGSVFEIRHLVERIQTVTPLRAGGVVVGGGGAQSGLWLSVLRDVLGRPISVAPREPVTAGAALLAAVATGHECPDWRPEPAGGGAGPSPAAALYDRLYREVWLPYREQSVDLSTRLTRITHERR